MFQGYPRKFYSFALWPSSQHVQLPPPNTCGSKNGSTVTVSRIQLKDGRHLAYKEYGLPKDNAKHKIVFVHGFDSCRHDASAITALLSTDFFSITLPNEIVESEGLYVVSFGIPGYGESDPKNTRTNTPHN
ncbi:hypothetical protein MIMGU_mgv1a024275mg, partial [Erythranthe guttata]